MQLRLGVSTFFSEEILNVFLTDLNCMKPKQESLNYLAKSPFYFLSVGKVNYEILN